MIAYLNYRKDLTVMVGRTDPNYKKASLLTVYLEKSRAGGRNIVDGITDRFTNHIQI